MAIHYRKRHVPTGLDAFEITIMPKIYGIGAAVVIVGALFN
jgi:hypothetical protein